MATSTWSANTTPPTDADYRAWVTGLSNAIKLGLVQTADTGQANIAGILTGAGERGYEVFRFDDALQNTAPVYLKFSYFITQDYLVPYLNIMIGTGTNGTGNITGNPYTCNTNPFVNPAGAVGNATYYASSANNRLVAVLHTLTPGSSNAGRFVQFFGVERTHDGLGNDTNSGVILMWTAANGARNLIHWTPTVAGTVETNWGMMMPTGTTGSSGTVTQLYPIFPNQGVMINPCMNGLGYFHDDIPGNTSITFTYYGAQRTYLTLGTPVISNVTTRHGGAATPSLAIRWE